MRVGKVMTSPPVSVAADRDLGHVARLMRDENIGFLPVIDEGRIVGILTDRDIVVRILARLDVAARISAADLMTRRIIRCRTETSVEAAAILMADSQVRRLPVVDRDGRLVGVLSIGDIAEDCSELLAGETLGEIVERR